MQWGGIKPALLSVIGLIYIYIFYKEINKKIKLHNYMKSWEYNKESIIEFASLSGKDLVTVFLAQEINQLYNKILLKKVCIARLIATIVTSVFAFLLLHYSYVNTLFKSFAVFVLLAYVYTLLYFDKYYFLNKEAKKMPESPLSEVINSQIADETEKHKYVFCKVLSIILLPLSLTCFVILNAESKITIEKTEVGYAVTSYRHGLLVEEMGLEIPDTFEGNPIVSIEEKAIANNNRLTEIVIPDSVLYIEKSAFSNCKNLSKIKMSRNIIRINSAAFKGCSSIEWISLPESLKEIGGEVFMYCTSLKSAIIPSGVTEIRGGCFSGCSSLENIKLHDGIVDIHANAFENCSSLKEIDLPPKITEIHAYTFEGCAALKQISLPLGVTRIALTLSMAANHYLM